MKETCCKCWAEVDIASYIHKLPFCSECVNYCNKCDSVYIVSCKCDSEEVAIDKFIEYCSDKSIVGLNEVKAIFTNHIQYEDAGTNSLVLILPEHVIIYSDDLIKQTLARYKKYGLSQIVYAGNNNYWYIAPKLKVIDNNDSLLKTIRQYKLLHRGNQYATNYFIEQLQILVDHATEPRLLQFAFELLDLCRNIEEDFIKIDSKQENIMIYNGLPIPYDFLYIGIKEWKVGECKICKKRLKPEIAINFDGTILCTDCAKKHNIIENSCFILE